MRNSLFKILAVLPVFFPIFTMAQGTGVSGILFKLNTLVGAAIPVLIGLALLVFLWGVYKHVFSESDKDRSEARNMMVYGVISLFVIVSMWGLVNVISATFGDAISTDQNISENFRKPDSLRP